MSTQVPEFFGLKIKKAAERLSAILCNNDLTISVAESCTGGLLAGALTSIPGSSAYFQGGIIAYANRVKINLLDVDEAILDEHGAVSSEVCAQMAAGVLKNIDSDISIAVTGIAGPGGGSSEKPVGLVYIGIRVQTKGRVTEHIFSGSRSQIRNKSVEKSIVRAIEELI